MKFDGLTYIKLSGLRAAAGLIQDPLSRITIFCSMVIIARYTLGQPIPGACTRRALLGIFKTVFEYFVDNGRGCHGTYGYRPRARFGLMGFWRVRGNLDAFRPAS